MLLANRPSIPEKSMLDRHRPCHSRPVRADLHEDPTDLTSPPADARDPLQAEEMALMPAPPRHWVTAPSWPEMQTHGRTRSGDSCGIIHKHELGRGQQEDLYFFIRIPLRPTATCSSFSTPQLGAPHRPGVLDLVSLPSKIP